MILHDSAKPCIKGPEHNYGSAAWVSISSISFELPFMIDYFIRKFIHKNSGSPLQMYILSDFNHFQQHLYPD
jgi:hypothetical protein